MRGYVQFQAQFRADTWAFAMLRLIIRNLRRRDMVEKLEQFSDHQLLDIGLNTADLRFLGRLPLTADFDWERERLRLIASRRINPTKNT